MVDIPQMPNEPGLDVVDAVCAARRPDFRSMDKEAKDALRAEAVDWLRAWRDQSVPVVPASPARDIALARIMERDACTAEMTKVAAMIKDHAIRGILESTAEMLRQRPIDGPAKLSALPASTEKSLRDEIAREFLACNEGFRDRNREWADKLFDHVDETGHHGDCPKVERPVPCTCSACVIEEAYQFADGILKRFGTPKN
jgi:hypothetical protein